MKKLIDQYITKRFSKRAFYGHGKKYQNTKFQPGSKYVVDVKENKIVILPHDESQAELKPKKVSKRNTSNGLIPVIDVKDKKSMQVFEGVEYLQIKVYEDQIVVEGYVEDESSTKTKSKSRISNVTDIKNILKVKKIAQAVVPHAVLNKVAGGYDQLDIFNLETQSVSISKDNVVDIDQTLQGLKIPLRVASLFSGAGLLDFGFKKAGFDIVFALEKDEDAVETYRHNLGNHIVCADITKFDKTSITPAEVMIAGPPCQGHSNANRTTNHLDNPNNLLMKEYIKAIQANHNCKVFVIENVEGMFTGGDGVFLDEIKSELSDFEITTGVLTASDFGSAQRRKRAFVIGSKIGRIELPKPLQSAVKTVRDAFKGLHNGIANQLDFSKPKADTLERMKHVPQGGNWRNLPDHLRTSKMKDNGSTHSSVYRRLAWDEPSITIANPRKSNITHPEENRSISVREAARLFDLPDTFEFRSRPTKGGKFSLSAIQQQVCNGVPAQLGYHIARVIKNAIMKFNLSNRAVKREEFKVESTGQIALF